MLKLTEADRAMIGAAITAAEMKSDGEVVAAATPSSDAYHDVALHWAVALLIAVLAWFAAFPGTLDRVDAFLFGGWRAAPGPRELLTLLMVLAVLNFTVVLLVLRIPALRMALTPASTKQRRVRRRAIMVFKAGAERRTIGRTGILIYLSLAEHRAEIVADEALHKVTNEDVWGEAMAALVAELRAGRPAEGLVAAIGIIGEVLATHFPKTDADTNEIPDRLVEL